MVLNHWTLVICVLLENLRLVAVEDEGHRAGAHYTVVIHILFCWNWLKMIGCLLSERESLLWWCANVSLLAWGASCLGWLLWLHLSLFSNIIILTCKCVINVSLKNTSQLMAYACDFACETESVIFYAVLWIFI